MKENNTTVVEIKKRAKKQKNLKTNHFESNRLDRDA